MNESLFQIANDKVEQLKESLRAIQREKDSLMMRERAILRQFEAWKVILDAENPQEKQENGPTVPDAHEVLSALESPSKTDVARRYSLQRGELGFTAKQLAAYLETKGLGNNPGFANSFVFRMVKGKELAHIGDGRLKSTPAMAKTLDLNEKEATEAAS